MRTRLFDGEVYIKASELARQYHYTADYLGQLARQNKVKAKLAGRSWYIKEVSLLEYRKRDAVQSQTATSKTAVTTTTTLKLKKVVGTVPKRRASKTRSRNIESIPEIATKKPKATSRKNAKPQKQASVTAQKIETPAASTNQAVVKTGLWQKAAGWLKKIQGA